MLIACALLGSAPRAMAGGGGGAGTGTGTGIANPSQMRSWLFKATLVNFNSGTATATAQTGGSIREASAAAFDANNNLLFYVNRNGNTLGMVYSAANVAVGQLNGIDKPNRPDGESSYAGCGREMLVVPVPGSSYRYYLFYTLATNFLSNVVAYAIIDCSCGTPRIAQNSQRVDNTAAAEYLGSVAPGLAATRQLADGTRKLYVAGGSSAISYPLLANGTIGGRLVLTGSGNVGGGNSEAEVSPDGNYLAWAAANNSVYVYNLSGASVAVTPVFTSSNPINGLEFSGGSDKLFIAGSALSAYTLSSATTTTIAASGSNPLAANTQLERAYDGLIYGASSSGALCTLNPGTLAVAVSSLSFSLAPTPIIGGPSVFTFPDQIDGEDYASAYFLSSAPLISRGLKVDGYLLRLPATSVPAPAATPVYTCNPLTLSSFAPSSASVVSYDVIISRTDADGNVLASGYAATYTNVSLPLNLGALNNGYLANAANTGYYQVKLIGYDACVPRRTSEAIGRMQVSSLTAGSANYNFNLCTSTGPATGTTANAPAELGIYGGGGINFTSSSGSYDTYQVTLARYVPGTNPAQFTPVGSTPDLARPTNSTGYTVSPSYLAGQAGLGAGYFQQGNPGFGVVHQLILTVKSPCGTSMPVVGYFKTSDINCRLAQATPAPDKPQLFPNPLTGTETAHLRFTLPTAQAVRLELTDALTGQVRLTVLHNALRPAGEQDVTIDTGKLPAGVYLYRLTTAAGTTVGRVLKAE